MKIQEIILTEELEEGWREKALGAAAGAAMFTGLSKLPAPDIQKTPAPVTQTQPAEKKAQTKSFNFQTNNPVEREIHDIAVKEGLRGAELAQFMAQCKWESGNFEDMHEKGPAKKQAQTYFQKKSLGNRSLKAAERTRGKGPIMLSGEYNYRNASKFITNTLGKKDPEFLLQYGVDPDDEDFLIKRPELAADPILGTYAAIWYWKARVRPQVSNWYDTIKVTKAINPRGLGMQQRHDNFQAYHGDFG